MIADEAVKPGVRAKAHNIPSLKLEYGTLVPMRLRTAISISKWCRFPRSAPVHDFADSRQAGPAAIVAPLLKSMTVPWRFRQRLTVAPLYRRPAPKRG